MAASQEQVLILCLVECSGCSTSRGYREISGDGQEDLLLTVNESALTTVLEVKVFDLLYLYYQLFSIGLIKPLEA